MHTILSYNISIMASQKGLPVRQLTGLESTIYNMKKAARGDFETTGVHKQCEAVIGPPDVNTLCWLCGFHVDSINNIERLSEGTIQSEVKTPMLDKATCEHVLPIKLAYTLATLYQNKELTKPPPNLDKLLHTEYEYAHNLCNFAKLDNYFLSWEDFYKGRDFCSLTVNEEKINNFLMELINYTRSGKHTSQIGLTFPDVGQAQLPNLVQANLMIYAYNTNRNWFDPAVQRDIIQEWLHKRFAVIKAKIEGLIEYIKEADDCGGALQGRWSKSMTDRMKGAKGASSMACAPLPAARRGSSQSLEEGVCGLMQLLDEKAAEKGMMQLDNINYNNGNYTMKNAAKSMLQFRRNFTLSTPSGYGRGGAKKRYTRRRKVARRKNRRHTRK